MRLGVLVVLLAVLALIQVAFGALWIPPARVLEALTGPPRDFTDTIILQQRLPRVAVACTVGAALAVAGLVLQKVMQNVLVSPSTLGINAGATVAVVLAMFFGMSGGTLLFPALIGGTAAMGATLLASRLIAGQGDRRLDLVLAGSMIGILCSSVSTFVISLDPDLFGDLMGWLVGDIGNFDYLALPVVLPVVAVALAIALILCPQLDLLTTGEDQARLLGVNTALLQGLALALAVLLAVAAVVVVGPIGFIGLVVPHLVKLAMGETGRATLVAVALTGPCLLMLADILARVALAPRVLHVGTVMGLSGGAIFLVMVLALVRRGRA
ncbi:FecCD family ABC transporter permease [Falsirhodobacter sp. 20TX0035]|uniref:FecCD family ABC transporter permease n=1 Tax=Falsirhodobacter sp. 20TX0035 TaxID=3022019 RepID=UPI00232F055A|nr:iron ABC transporter permease [Falsirhodobacter sp. 20TX0035]MDB6454259.1 iron ABC transporter permease [Falsirhodobacter sp. 20TX0035]